MRGFGVMPWLLVLGLAFGCSPATGAAVRGAEPMQSPEARLSMVILAVQDVERAAQFYESAFGWPRRTNVPVLVEFDLPSGSRLALYQREGFARNTGRIPTPASPSATSGTELYLHCEDLDACIVRVVNAGGRPLAERGRRPWGDEAAYFADPDGNVVVVASPVKKGEEGPAQETVIIRKEVTVQASAHELFELWSTVEGVRTFFGPDARIELRQGGAYEIYFMPEAPEGSRGSEGCSVLEFEPERHLAFTWNFPPTLPALRDKKTRVDLWFQPISPDITQVVLKHSQWGTGGQWPRGVDYFERAWEVVLRRLVHRFRFGPVDWDNPPE
jgi:predicted enzyme related to lactoylglutathione lyase/uncharacterized protein YndB with AHSA1/START domain